MWGGGRCRGLVEGGGSLDMFSCSDQVIAYSVLMA